MSMPNVLKDSINSGKNKHGFVCGFERGRGQQISLSCACIFIKIVKEIKKKVRHRFLINYSKSMSQHFYLGPSFHFRLFNIKIVKE